MLGLWANNKTCAPRWFSGGESLNVVDDGHWESQLINLYISKLPKLLTHPQLINLGASIKSAWRLVIWGCWSGWQNGFSGLVNSYWSWLQWTWSLDGKFYCLQPRGKHIAHNHKSTVNFIFFFLCKYIHYQKSEIWCFVCSITASKACEGRALKYFISIVRTWYPLEKKSFWANIWLHVSQWTECNCTTLIWWDLAIHKQADKHIQIISNWSIFGDFSHLKEDKVKIRSYSYISTPKLNPKISKKWNEAALWKNPKIQTYSKHGGSKTQRSNWRKLTFEAKKKLFNTFEKITSQLKIPRKAKKKPKRNAWWKIKKPIKTIHKKSSDFKKLLKLEYEHVCVRVC
jgi:hypothetical protein